MNILAKIVSYVFHPLLMATYLITLFSFLFPAAIYPIRVESRFTIILFLFIITFVLPVINILFYKFFGVITSISMVNRNERIKPFFLIVFLYGLFTFLLFPKTLRLGDNLLNIIFIIDALVLISFLITLFFKISIHCMGIWGVIGMLLPLNNVADDGSLYIPILVSIIAAGMVMSARLQLNAHTPREVIVGSVTGFAVGFFGLLILF